MNFAVHINRMKRYIDPNERPIEPPKQDVLDEPFLDYSDIPEDSFEVNIPNTPDSSDAQEPNINNTTQPTENDADKSLVDNVNIFNAEKILKKRKHKGNDQYLVKWANYPVSKSTWEPIENILDHRLIRNFKQKFQ